MKKSRYKEPLGVPYPGYSMMEMLRKEDLANMKKHNIKPEDYALHVRKTY